MTDTSPDLLEALRSGAVLASVKPLEWKHTDSGGAWAKSNLGLLYEARPDGSWLHRNGDVEMAGSTLDEAKAAAQADYEARILSALSPDHTAAVVALIEGLSDRAESCDQWRKLALQFDRHRIEAMSLIKSVAAGTAGATECAAFAAAPPPLTSPAEAERDALREALERIAVQMTPMEHWADFGRDFKVDLEGGYTACIMGARRALTQDQPNVCG